MPNFADAFCDPDTCMTQPNPLNRADRSVFVDAPARLHLGFLDPSGSLGRRFASLGMVIDDFDTRVEIHAAEHNGASAASQLRQGSGAQTLERMVRYLESLQRETRLRSPAHLHLHAAPPAHAGFGSGTQLALACGRAFCQFHGLDIPTRRLAAMLDRGERSGVGLAGFDQGGLLLDGGPGAEGTVAPLISRIAFPDSWRVVLLLDDRIDGLSGPAERVAMATLAPFPRSLAADLCHQVLMRVLPGALEGVFDPFAEGVSTVQKLIGDYFAPAQGGSMYTSAAVGRALEWVRTHHVAGIGQSSWGPTGFAIVRSQNEAESVLAGLRQAGLLDDALQWHIVRGRNHGATVRAD